jgi:lysophospholipase L1-like esterase
MLYEYTDAGCCQQFFQEPPSLWERWDHSRFEPELVTVFLGTNDASYTKNFPERKKGFSLMYQSFLRKIHQRHPQAKILCMLGTMDQSLCSTVNHAVREFSKSCENASVKYLQLPLQDEETDGTGTFWHPTEATHEKIAALVTDAAKKLMEWDS